MDRQEVYEHKQIVKLMAEKKYKEAEFNLNYPKMKAFIKAVNKMDFTKEAFQTIRIFIRFFRFPALILFRPFYERLEREKEALLNFTDEQKKTGCIVMKIFEDKDYPCLQCYTKAGFSKDINLDDGKENKVFKNHFFQFEKQLNQIVADKSKYQLDQLQFMLDDLAMFRKTNKLDPIFELCIEAYQQLVLEKRKEISSLMQYRPERIEDDRKRNDNQKILIQTNQGTTIKEINDPKVANDYLCCRPYFYYNEIINEPETTVQEYKNYKYPFNKFLNETLLKTIVGFLNGRGGIIYIGIYENVDSKKRLVKGEIYNESLKEDVLKHFRYLGQRISPEIVNNQLYRLEYVPIRNEEGFLAGEYIIRLRISKGQKDELYSFKNYDSQEYIAFRTANEVLTRRLSQQILELYRKKLSQPEQLEEVNHSGACKKPELGRPIFENSKGHSQPEPKWINKKPVNPSYRQKQPQNSPIAFLFIGDKISQELMKYSHDKYKKLPVIQPNEQSVQLVRALIDTSQSKKDYIPVSFRLYSEEQNFKQIWDLLQENNVLVGIQKPSRTTFIFNSIREAIYAASVLNKKKIPFNFALPK